jgi:hypothetical protein
MLARVGRAVLAILPFLVLLEVTSLPHLLAEVYGEDEDCCERCDDAVPGQKCPPLCPTCACVHVSQMMPPVESPRPALTTSSAVPAPFSASQAPDEPDSEGIFHPPRV